MRTSHRPVPGSAFSRARTERESTRLDQSVNVTDSAVIRLGCLPDERPAPEEALPHLRAGNEACRETPHLSHRRVPVVTAVLSPGPLERGRSARALPEPARAQPARRVVRQPEDARRTVEVDQEEHTAGRDERRRVLDRRAEREMMERRDRGDDVIAALAPFLEQITVAILDAVAVLRMAARLGDHPRREVDADDAPAALRQPPRERALAAAQVDRRLGVVRDVGQHVIEEERAVVDAFLGQLGDPVEVGGDPRGVRRWRARTPPSASGCRASPSSSSPPSRPSRAPGPCPASARGAPFGVTCHERPYLSLSHPHWAKAGRRPSSSLFQMSSSSA